MLSISSTSLVKSEDTNINITEHGYGNSSYFRKWLAFFTLTTDINSDQISSNLLFNNSFALERNSFTLRAEINIEI